MLGTFKVSRSRLQLVAALLAATACTSAGVEPIRSAEELQRGHVDSGFSGAEFSSYYGGHRYEFDVSCRRLDATPIWKSGQLNPPLSARKAVEIARAQQERLAPKKLPWQVSDVVLLPTCSTGHWVYEVRLLPPDVFDGINIGFQIPVLMTGETIEPIVSDWTNSFAVASPPSPGADAPPSTDVIYAPRTPDATDIRLRTMRREWELSASSPSLPAQDIASRSGVAGLWVTPAKEGGASLALIKGPADTYEVEYESGGCLDSWRLTRLARYEHGVLTLNFPVEQYSGRISQRFFAVSIDGDDYLLPEADISTYEKYQRSTSAVQDRRWYAGFMMKYVPRD
jgi:hypothetical protein